MFVNRTGIGTVSGDRSESARLSRLGRSGSGLDDGHARSALGERRRKGEMQSLRQSPLRYEDEARGLVRKRRPERARRWGSGGAPRESSPSPRESSCAPGQRTARRPCLPFRVALAGLVSARSVGFASRSRRSGQRSMASSISARGSQRPSSPVPLMVRAERGWRAQRGRRSRGCRMAQAGLTPAAGGRPLGGAERRAPPGTSPGRATGVCPLLQPLSSHLNPVAPRSGVSACPQPGAVPLQGDLEDGIQDGRPIIRARGRASRPIP